MNHSTKSKFTYRTFSEKEKLNYCQQWEISGLSKKKFQKQFKLPSSFYSWCNNLLPSQGKTLEKEAKVEDQNHTSNLLLPIVSSMPNITKSSANATDISCVCDISGIKVELTLPLPLVVTLIKELSDAATVIR